MDGTKSGTIREAQFEKIRTELADLKDRLRNAEDAYVWLRATAEIELLEKAEAGDPTADPPVPPKKLTETDKKRYLDAHLYLVPSCEQARKEVRRIQKAVDLAAAKLEAMRDGRREEEFQLQREMFLSDKRGSGVLLQPDHA